MAELGKPARCVVDAAGVDTWSPSWYVDPEGPVAARLSELAVQPAPRARLLEEPVMGHRVGWFPGSGLVFAEGHPRAGGLAAGDELPAVLSALEKAIEERGVPLPKRERPFASLGPTCEGRAGVRRLDTTADLRFGSGAEGLAVLAGIAAVVRDAGGTTAEVRYGLRGQVETVYLHGRSGRTVLGRWYDKGVESGTAPRGELVRPEDQRRFPKAGRRDVSELSSMYVRELFHRRFVPLWKASKGVTVAGPMVLAEKLHEAIEAGEITARQAEQVAGHLLMQAAGRPMPGISRASRYRRRAAARRLGLVLADGVMQEVEVSLQDVLEELLDTEQWDVRNG